MNRAVKAIAVASSLRFLHSSLATRVLTTRNQVTHSSLYTPLLHLGRTHDLRFPYTHHRIYFSSKPTSILELVLTNDWSQGVEHELEKCCPSLSHETVLYVLKRLDENPEKALSFFNWVSEKEWFRPSSSVFSLIVTILANKETIKQFWVTLKMMKTKGFYLDGETYKPILAGFKKAEMWKDSNGLKKFYDRMLRENGMQRVVTKVVRIISGSEWGDEVKKKLAKLKIQLSDNLVGLVLKELRICPLKAYKFFHWVGEQSGYEHSTVTYNEVARVLARPGSIEEFWSVIEEMKSLGHDLDIYMYVKISRKLENVKMLEDAVKLYELMVDGSYQPSAQDCSILLNSISESDSPNLDLVVRVGEKYESTGNTLSKGIYDGIHRSLTAAGRFDEAENFVKIMRNAGYEPDNVIYSQVVIGLCKMRRLEEAYKVLEEMESCGCIPDSNTWSVLIQGHCAANEVDKALVFLRDMVKKGCVPDAAAIGVLVDCFVCQKKIGDAYKLLVEMVSYHDTSPWHCTYRKLIENLLGIKKFDEALDLVCLMRKHKHPPFIQPVVQYISKFGTVEDAAKFLKAWSKESCMSHSAYLHVFRSLIGEDRLSEAKDLLSKCRSRIRRRKEICDLFASVENSIASS
ncbi:pentatricopeptide repeat-containing protein At3g48250, chloroplastic-like [Lotus japonicus]|uniref:pentatricopeptide repeat-containing protein At3g48250, chloroplastic-like n=1 Tax=Lotus japonicus TaxID=34305 RepID=UPI00258773BC|nr:pentatricopeptide repeat-containing protein At3g48250, chloroplastic-like [Lotus japonicus]